MSSSASPQEQHKAALRELSSLGRVSHRLALVDTTERLQTVLEKLLPRLLKRIGDNHRVQLELGHSNEDRKLREVHDKIHAKLVEMLSHTMKRVRDDQGCQLPCLEILKLLLEDEGKLSLEVVKDDEKKEAGEGMTENEKTMSIPKAKNTVDPFTLNLALAFLTLGVPRCSESTQVEGLLPAILVLVGHYSGLASIRAAAKKIQSNQIAHLLLRAIEQLMQFEKEASKAKASNGNRIKLAREVCQRDSRASGAVFDLLLDALLYQPVPMNSNIPPCGLSQAGHERLKQGSSTVARDWAAEKATKMQLMELKLALLDFLSPSRRWALFMPNTKAADSSDSGSATVALLVVAAGDTNLEVARCATLYLKIYHDSFRGSLQKSTTQLGGVEETTKASDAWDSMRLTCTLLSLALGQTNAESALSKVSTGSNDKVWLGLSPDQPNSSDSSQLFLSLKRRAAVGSVLASIMGYVSEKILGEDAQVLNNLEPWEVIQMTTICLLTAQRTLSNLRTSSGQTILQAKAYLAAAQLLNVLCVRLSTFYDNTSIPKDDAEHFVSSDINAATLSIMSRALTTACSVLAPASTKRPSATMGASASSMEGSVAIRDACYGVLCSLSRSRFVLAEESYIFACGNTNHTANGGTVSIDTASLLFGCAANEVEVLLPRATAALDALLGAYLRVYGNTNDKEDKGASSTAEPVNPWANPVSDANIRRGPEKDTPPLDPRSIARALTPLLWAASQNSQPKASRVAAARWTGDFMKRIDVSGACHLLCFLAGDADVTASSMGRDGLGLPSKISMVSSGDDYSAASNSTGLPEFGDFTSNLFPSKNAGDLPSDYFRPRYWDFSFAGKAAAFQFGLKCLFADIYGNEDNGPIRAFVSTLADTLILFGSKAVGVAKPNLQGGDAIDLLEECTRCLVATLATSSYARSLLVKAVSSTKSGVSLCLQDMEFLSVTVNSSRARRHLAEACGKLYEDDHLWQDDDGQSARLNGWLSKTRIDKTLKECSSKLSDVKRNLFMIGEVHGAAFLGAQCFRAMRLRASKVPAGANNENDACTMESLCMQNAAQLIEALGTGTLHSDEVVSNACSDALAAGFDYFTIDAPILDTRLYDSAASALSNLAVALLKFGTKNDTVDAPRTAKLAVAAGKCLAASTSGAGAKATQTDVSVGLGSARLACVDALFSLLGSPAFRADEEIALLAGEALALYADAYSPEGAVWSSEVSEWPKVYDEKEAQELPPFQHVLYVILRNTYASNSPHKRTACAAALLGVVGRAANGVNKHNNYSRRSLVVELKRSLSEVQRLFISLLSDPKSKHLSRESCCLGLAACRGLTNAGSDGEGPSRGSGDSCRTEHLNQRLLRAFGQTANYGGSAYQESREQAAQRRATEQDSDTPMSAVMEQFGEESEIGGANGLGESALTSYKEMAAAAVSLGRIDMLYSLLLLSVSHEVWFTFTNKYKYCAASLLGSDSLVGSPTNSEALRVALRPHLGKLLPRILRARHDPNKQTREQMTALWLGLTGGGSESRSAISQHLLPTIDTLIDDCTSKLWRARAGACGALAEIIVGRSWDSLGGGPAVLDDDDIHTRETSKLTAGIRLLRLFRVSMRALDDVRGNVREAGETLARTIRGLTIRLCNPRLKDDSNGIGPSNEAIRSHERNASASSATTLRWLIKNGLNQQCSEATGICLSCLVEIIGVVKPKILQPLIPDLLKSLLFSMSGLEPSALNYLQARSGAHASDSALSYENLERVRLRLAQTGPLAAAVTKLLDMLPSVSIQTQKEVVPQLDSALRQSVGFATRAATADAVSSLCNSCPAAFHFPGSSSTNPAVRLLRALYFASERERGQGVSDKMIHALGSLAALCPGSSVRGLAMKSCNKYNKSTGNNDDPASRRASAASLRSIAVRATNQFSDGGASDVWFRRVLPVAFLGKKDQDSKVSKMFDDVWEEGSIVSNSMSSQDLGTIEEQLLPYLVEECRSALLDNSWARRVSGANGLLELSNRGILSPAPRRTTDSKSIAGSSMREKRRAQATNSALNASIELLSKPRLWIGKSVVIDCAVSIAVKWTAVLLDQDSNVRSVLGWEREDTQCPWQPIQITSGELSGDLFVGDGWFGQKHVDGEAIESTQDAPSKGAILETEMEAEDQIDFEECDTLEENEEPSGDEEGSTEETMQSEAKILVFAGFVSFLMEQAMPTVVSTNLSDSEEFLPYRVAGFKGLRDILASLPGSNSQAIRLKRDLYWTLAPRLLSLCVVENHSNANSKSEVPPVISARALDCLAACCWEDMGSKNDEMDKHGVPGMLELAKLIKATGGEKQSAWAVREATRLCLGNLAANCHLCVLRNQTFVSVVVDSANDALKDKKFWKVRFAGLKLLRALVDRAGTSAIIAVSQNPEEGERQLVLEALLPHKEDIMTIASKSLTDREARVTALSSEIIGRMSWWP